MGALFIFIFISVLVISALLFFNKGEKAQEIKSALKDIYENFKEIFSNLKKLFLIIKELIQSKSDQGPTQLKDESTESQLDVNSEPEVTSELEVTSSPEINYEPEIIPTSELEKTSEDSINEENIDIKW